MFRHVPIVDVLGRFATSAEPARPEPWDELHLCQEVVRAEIFPDRVQPFAATVEQVFAAAAEVEGAVQFRLRRTGGAGVVLELRDARPLWNAQYQAHTAVAAKASRKDAKAIQVEAAEGQPPLTICVSYVYRRFPEQVLRYNAPDMLDDPDYPGSCRSSRTARGDGCGKIIVDSREPRALKRYCDHCASRAGRTLNAGLAKKALARLRASRKV